MRLPTPHPPRPPCSCTPPPATTRLTHLAGDWVCCQHRPAHRNGALQLNFAANSTCCREACGADFTNGLSYEEIEALVRTERKRAGSKAGSKVGSKAESKAGSTPGSKAGSKPGSKSGSSPATSQQRGEFKATGANLQLDCRNCGKPFTFTAKEQRFFEEKKFVPPSK